MPRSGAYSGDSGKHTGAPSGGSTGVPSADGGKDEGANVLFGSEADASVISCHLVEQYYTRILEPNVDYNVHSSGFSMKQSGDNTPYADQHAPMSSPETPGPKKGSV